MNKDQNATAAVNTWIELRSIIEAGAGNRCQSLRALLACWWAEARWMVLGAWRIMKSDRRKIFFCMLAGGGMLGLMFSRDLEWLAAIRHLTSKNDQAHALARHLSYWGDFAGFNLFVFGTLSCFAFVRRSPFLRRMVIAAVLGTLLTAGTANILRATTGRSRPGSGLAPGFYGPSLSARKQSFPSAHTATSFGASIPVAVAFPPAGVPMLLVSGGVAWSRMENNRHHPSDVMLSIMLSCVFGIPLGLVIRRQRRTKQSSLDQHHHLHPTEAGDVEPFDDVGARVG
jgi:membrane-associated phospholipid phosphatase